MNFATLERKLLQAGLYRLDSHTSNDMLLGRRIPFRQVRGILRAQFLRLGARKDEDLSLVYSRQNNLVSLILLESGSVLEFEGPQVAPALWHLGIDLNGADAD
ncbi:MAG: hypothetical protein K0Q68_1951 [Moraxellaceae bacterium]|jgi:hypothetical protein|nr:hypothetical protein [Moraxellaceae bacterium]